MIVLLFSIIVFAKNMINFVVRSVVVCTLYYYLISSVYTVLISSYDLLKSSKIKIVICTTWFDATYMATSVVRKKSTWLVPFFVYFARCFADLVRSIAVQQEGFSSYPPLGLVFGLRTNKSFRYYSWRFPQSKQRRYKDSQ